MGSMFLIGCLNVLGVRSSKEDFLHNKNYGLSKKGNELKSEMITYIREKFSQRNDFDLPSIIFFAEKAFEDLVGVVAEKSSKIKQGRYLDDIRSATSSFLGDAEDVRTPKSEALIFMAKRLNEKELFFGAILKYSLDRHKIQKSQSVKCIKSQSLFKKSDDVIMGLCNVLNSKTKNIKSNSLFGNEGSNELGQDKYFAPARKKSLFKSKSVCQQVRLSQCFGNRPFVREGKGSLSAYSLDLKNDKLRSQNDISRCGKVRSTYSFDLKSNNKKEISYIFHPIFPEKVLQRNNLKKPKEPYGLDFQKYIAQPLYKGDLMKIKKLKK